MTDAEFLLILRARDEFSKVFRRARGGLRAMNNEVRKSGVFSKRAATSINQLGVRTNFTWQQMLRFAGALGGVQLGISVMSTAVIGLRNAIIGFNASMETAILQFETLTGSAQFALQWLEELQEFAARTPFAFNQLVEASRQLEVFGGAALNNIEMIQLLGDTAAATQTDMKNLTFWVGRFYGALQNSRPLGEMLTRFQELGVLTPSARDEIEELAKAGAPLQQIWETLTENFERFEGAMEKQSQTWTGLTSTIKDNVSRLLGEAFTPLFNALKVLFANLNALITSPEAEQAVAAFAARLQTALVNVITWLRDNGPQVLQAFISLWQAIVGPLTIVARLVVILVSAFSRLAFWIGENDKVLKVLIATFALFKIGQIALALRAMSLAWFAAAAGAGAFAVAIQVVRTALVTTGIGAILVGLGLLILLVGENWVKTQNLMIDAFNGIQAAQEFFINAFLSALSDFVSSVANTMADLIDIFLSLPDFLTPFNEELTNARDSLRRFETDVIDSWSVTLGRLDKVSEDFVKDQEDLFDFEDPFANIGEDIERLFDELDGNFEITAKIKSDLELALESIGKQIQDEITKAYIRGGESQARIVAEQQAALLEQAFETARELESLFGQDLAQALLTTFNTLKQASDSVNVSPLLIALAAINARNEGPAGFGVSSGGVLAATSGVQEIRFGNTFIEQINMTAPESGGVDPEALSNAVNEGVKRGRFSEVGI